MKEPATMRSKHLVRWICLIVLGIQLTGFFLTGVEAQEHEPRLWVYAPVNFQVDQDVARLIELLARTTSGLQRSGHYRLQIREIG